MREDNVCVKDGKTGKQQAAAEFSRTDVLLSFDNLQVVDSRTRCGQRTGLGKNEWQSKRQLVSLVAGAFAKIRKKECSCAEHGRTCVKRVWVDGLVEKESEGEGSERW